MSRNVVMEFEDLRIQPDALELLPPRLCRQYGILPLKLARGVLTVACADPVGFSGEADIAFWSGARVALIPVTRESLDAGLDRYLPREADRLDNWQALGHLWDELAIAEPLPSLAASERIEPSRVHGILSDLEELGRGRESDHRFHGVRGDLYTRLRKLDEAAACFSRAAAICEERGDWAFAVVYLRKQRGVHPSDRTIYERLARNFLQMGMRDEMLEAFVHVAELAVVCNDISAAVALFCELTDCPPEESELVGFGTGLFGESLKESRQLAAGLWQLLAEEVESWETPDLYYLRVKLGLCFTSFAYHQEALEQFEKAATDCSPKGHPLWTVGIRFLWDGQLSTAMELFLLALDEADLTLRDRLHIEYDLAMVCEQKGELARAYQLLLEVSKLEPDFLATPLVLKRLRRLLKD